MNLTLLLQKLITIEMAVGTVEPSAVRSMLIELEDYVLETQKASAAQLATGGGITPSVALGAFNSHRIAL